MPKKYASMAERLIANSRVSETHTYNGTACWEWIGKRKANRSGTLYGALTVRINRGPNKGKVATVLAHRMSLVHLKGRRLSSFEVGRHLCNYTLCINPEHLVGGTQTANMRQCVREGYLDTLDFVEREDVEPAPFLEDPPTEGDLQ